MRVMIHRVAIGHSSDLVLEHLLMDAKMGVRIEIVVLGGHLIDGQLGAILVLATILDAVFNAISPIRLIESIQSKYK